MELWARIRVLPRTEQAWLDSVALPASQLLHGRPVRFWHDQAFVKPGGLCGGGQLAEEATVIGSHLQQ